VGQGSPSRCLAPVLSTPVAIVALVGCRSLRCSICGFVALDANMAWDPAVLDVYPRTVELTFRPEAFAGHQLAGAFVVIL
jgi:hypothetical protein